MNNIIKRVWNQNKMVNIEALQGMTFQAESGGHTFQISGVDDTGAAVPLSGTVAGVFMRPDRADIALVGSASDGVVSVTLTDDCYAVPGRFGLTIFVTSSGQKTAVYAAVGTVSVTSGGGVAGDTPQSVVDLINAIEEAVATIPASYSGLMADIAPTYSSSAVYPVGAYVYYNGDLYRCTTSITTAETWTAAHWTAAVLGDDLKSALNSKRSFIDVSNCYVPFCAKAGDSITVKSLSGQNMTPDSIRFFKKDGTFIAYWSLNGYMTPSRTFTYTKEEDAYFYLIEPGSHSMEPLIVENNSDRNTDYLTDITLLRHEHVVFDSLDKYHDFKAKAGDTLYLCNIDKHDDNTVQYIYLIEEDGSEQRFSIAPYTPHFKDRLISASKSIVGAYLSGGTFCDTMLVNLDRYTDASQEVNIEALQKQFNSTIKGSTVIPLLRNGSIGNPDNANAITTKWIIPIDKGKAKIRIDFLEDADDNHSYAMNYCLFAGASNGMTTTSAFDDATITKKNVDYSGGAHSDKPTLILDIDDLIEYDHISFAVFRYDSDNTVIPIRIDANQYSLRVTYIEGVDYVDRDRNNNEILKMLNNARHKKRNGLPNYLTFLHFSDIHEDKLAFNRIMSDAKQMESDIDEIICTGDIVGDQLVDITSWWDESVLTCIGNHDSATYDSSTGTYDWVAHNMGEREATFITPFKSNWGIQHESGKSYYYKDYTTSNVRLIVMDTMLYSYYESDATLGYEQNTWLSQTLDNAILNDKHVIIGVHSPHGGAVPVPCSFTKVNETDMPTYRDCDTPQSVIDIVAEKIGNGLKFIGYLCGHTHQDAIWDATGDKKQLMYCVTCAAMSYAPQWQNSDQDRSNKKDAYNLVTIDTANSLVKIIRGGGADIDEYIRERKAITINYLTGEIITEIA